ncbi:DR2241 family protein [Halorussus amylolyticus]|uniref:DR2241 family protein n=1 Tax=Halorussus amylolyticus TaxID=1126242 RepID=UPI003743386E
MENAPEAPGTDASSAVADTSGAVTDASDTRLWGELAITSTNDGNYDLRHREDRETAVGDLAGREVADLRETVRYADDGRYRPFSGERTLPQGWVLTDLDREGLLCALSIVYPASVEHWAAERTGNFDPVDFRAVADRQTGIYECVSDCSREEVARTVEACCGNCAKRRTWDAGEKSGEGERDGAIPCREPCSFLVAAAREFHQHESDGDRQASAEPTDEQPREEDASVPRGDLTDPANVYRVRYRRTGRPKRRP